MSGLVSGQEGGGPPAPVLRDALSEASLDPARPLEWRRAAPGVAAFELVQDGHIFGEMESAGRPGVDAFGECLGRSLELILQPRTFYGRDVRVDTRDPSEGGAAPFFDGAFFSWGYVTSAAGESMRWRRGIWHHYTHFLWDEEGVELLRVRASFLRFARMETRVTVEPAGAARADLPELLLLTWFLRAHADRPLGGRVFRRRDRTGGGLDELGAGPDGPEPIDAP